jgi:hypothetical protein
MRKAKNNRTDDVIKLRGCIEMALYGPGGPSEGKPLQYQKQDIELLCDPIMRRKAFNTVVTTGRAWVLKKLMSASDANVLGYIGIGSSTAGPLTSNTDLSSVVTRGAIGTWDLTGTTATAAPYYVAQVNFDTATGNAAVIGEAGLFNSSSGGTMLSRVTFSTIAKTTSNTLAISYTISN